MLLKLEELSTFSYKITMSLSNGVFRGELGCLVSKATFKRITAKIFFRES